MSPPNEVRARFAIRPGLTLWLGLALLAWVSWHGFNHLTRPEGLVLHLLVMMPAQFMLCVCIHDAVHGVLMRPRALNFAAGTLLALGVMLPFPLLRRTHLHHHDNVGHDEDPEHSVYGIDARALILRLPLIPYIYLSNWRMLDAKESLTSALALAGICALLVSAGDAFGWGAMCEAFVLPSVATIGWFGFMTVYVPHSRHSEVLMRYFTEHSGWHHDHHRSPQYPFNQYIELRDFHLRRGVFEPRGHEALLVRILATPLFGERPPEHEDEQ